MFVLCSYTFKRVEKSSELVWRMQRYYVVRQFHLKPILPPPLILVEHIFRLIRGILCRGQMSKNRCKGDRNFGLRE